MLDQATDVPQAQPGKLPIQNTWDRAELFRQLARAGNVIYPFQAAEAYSGFPESAVPSQIHYCLVVGDTVETWIYFWNRVFHLPHYIRSAWNTVCLPKEILTDASFDIPLREFVGEFTHRSSNHAPYVALESLECEENELAALSNRILKGIDVIPKVKKLGSDEFAAPDPKSFYPLDWGSIGVTHQQATTPDALLSPPTSPVPLSVGTWIMDLRVQYIPRFPFYSNEILTWRLPKRFGVADALIQGHESRIDRTNSLSVEMRHSGPFVLRRPPDGEVLVRALGVVRTRTYSEDFMSIETKPRFGKVSASDKALYVNGIIELFGGIQQAGQMFKHSFWRNIFESLSKRGPEAENKQIERVQNKLSKHKAAMASQLAKGGSEPIEWLSGVVIQLAREHRSDEADLTFTQIEKEFHLQREQYISTDPNFRPGTSEEDIRRDREEATLQLKDAVQALTDTGVLLQGVRVRCTNCGSGYWKEMGALHQETACEGCGATIHAPVEATWRYRLNSLVRNGIALHGCLPVIVALHNLRENARDAFIYTPGVALYKNWEDEEPEAEMDILCISDGHLVCGEVKSSASEFTADELQKLATVALEVRADRVVISAFRDERRVMGKLVLQLGAMVHVGCAVTTAGPRSCDFGPNPHP